MEAKGRPLSRLRARSLRNYSKAVGEAGGSKTFAVYVLINPPLPPPPRVPVSHSGRLLVTAQISTRVLIEEQRLMVQSATKQSRRRPKKCKMNE